MEQWIITLITSIISVIFSSILGWWIANKREKKVLKQKLEIETADEILRLTKKSKEELCNIVLTFYELKFSNYNEQLNKCNDKGNSMLYPTNALILDQIKNSIDNNMNELTSKVIKYNQTALDVILFMESRKVILQGFKIFVDQILELHEKQREAKDFLTETIYRFYLKGKIENNQLLSHSDFEQIKSSLASIEDIKNMLLCKFDDLEIVLQNEFIGKLFSEKISERNPIDARFKVLKIDKKIKW